MKTATVRELRNNFAKVSRWLDAGEKVEVTRRGVPYAKIELTAQAKKTKLRKKKLFDAAAHRKWKQETYGGKVFTDSIVLTMREEKDW